MNLRSKLVVIGLLLILTVTPLGYAILAWHPENPLRFHAQKFVPAAPGEKFGRLEIRIENTSSFPINLWSSTFSRIGETTPPRRGVVQPDLDAGERHIRVPAGTSVYVQAFWFSPDVPDGAYDNAIGLYIWTSPIKSRYMTFHEELRERWVRNGWSRWMIQWMPKARVVHDETPLQR